MELRYCSFEYGIKNNCKSKSIKIVIIKTNSTIMWFEGYSMDICCSSRSVHLGQYRGNNWFLPRASARGRPLRTWASPDESGAKCIVPLKCFPGGGGVCWGWLPVTPSWPFLSFWHELGTGKPNGWVDDSSFREEGCWHIFKHELALSSFLIPEI